MSSRNPYRFYSNPTKSLRLIQTVIYYIPTIRNPYNLSIITTELIHSPHILPRPSASPSEPVNLRVISFIIDGFDAAASRKASITDPTVSPQDWVTEIFNSLKNLKPEHQWRALGPIAGLLKAIYYQQQRQAQQLHNHSNDSHDMGVLANSSLLCELEEGFVSMINNTLRIYGDMAKLHNLENRLQIPLSIFTCAVTLPYLSDAAKKKIDYQNILSFAVSFVYFSPHVLDSGKPLRTLLNRDSNSLAVSLKENPALVKLGAVSILIQKAIQQINPGTSLSLVLDAMAAIHQFTETLSREWDNVTLNDHSNDMKSNPIAWNFLKVCLFSVSLALEGCTNWLLLSITRAAFTKHSIQITSTIVRSFSNLYFIVAHISLAGFPTFDFVYYTAIDILLDPQFGYEEVCSIVQDLSRPITSLNEQGRNDLISRSLVSRGRIIYLLNICELLAPFLPAYRSLNNQCLPISLSSDIIPLARIFLRPPNISLDAPSPTLDYFLPVLESAHSVMLSIITTPVQVYKRTNADQRGSAVSFFWKQPSLNAAQTVLSQLVNEIVPDYFKIVDSLFVGVLSFHQFTLAITTIIRAISPSSPVFSLDSQRAEWIIEQLIGKCDVVGAGVPLPAETETYDKPSSSTNTSYLHDGAAPPTVRAVILGSVIHSLPFLDIQVLEKYLNLLQENIDQTTKSSKISIPSILEEKRYLEVEMFNMISKELDQQKAGVGIRWWYQKSSL